MREQGSRADIIARRLGVTARGTGDTRGEATSQLYEKGQLGLPSWAAKVGGGLRVGTAFGSGGQRASAARARARSRIIARRVPEVNQGIYPAKRVASDLDHEDIWEAALAAMDETITLNYQSSRPFDASAPRHARRPAGRRGAKHSVGSTLSRTLPIRSHEADAKPHVMDTSAYVRLLTNNRSSIGVLSGA